MIETLETAGFSFIRAEAVTDLLLKEADEENIVTSVRIAWFDSFEETARFPSNFPVIVTYHTLMAVPISMSSKDAEKMDYLEVSSAFEDAGFL